MVVTLLELSPLILYEIATDIQVSGKWREFAIAVGFNFENIMMLEMTNVDRFPAENVMYHWFSRNPKIDDLGKVLSHLELEKTLHRLDGILTNEQFAKHINTLRLKRNNFVNPEIHMQFQEESYPIENSTNLNFQTQLSNTSTASSSTTTPEAGLVSIEMHIPSIARSALNEKSVEKEFEELTVSTNTPSNVLSNKPKDNINKISIFQTILNRRSTKFSVDEFNEEDFSDNLTQGKFSGYFHQKLRGNAFHIQTFSLRKICDSKKYQKKVHNIIWSLTNFRLYSLPIMSGHCFLDSHLFLIYPDHELKSLFYILHRTHIENHEIISANERLAILTVVGETLCFLHSAIPFGGFHGNVNSHNVLVGNRIILLSGFDKFYTEDTDYLKGLADLGLTKSDTNIEDRYQRDIQNYLELICETWWNIQPYKKDTQNYSLLDDITKNLTYPKMKYPGWNDGMHRDMQTIITKYNMDSKEIPNIKEIVDDLKQSNSPFGLPSYNEIDNSVHTNY